MISLNADDRVGAVRDNATQPVQASRAMQAWRKRVLSRRQARKDARILGELDPRLALDVGVTVMVDQRPASFAVDPRPLWGVGLTPRPVTHLPPLGRGSAFRGNVPSDRREERHAVGFLGSGANAGGTDSLLRWIIVAAALLTLGHLVLHPGAPESTVSSAIAYTGTSQQ